MTDLQRPGFQEERLSSLPHIPVREGPGKELLNISMNVSTAGQEKMISGQAATGTGTGAKSTIKLTGSIL